MNVHTTRFGTVEVDEQRIITLPAGLLGFSSYQRYTLLQPDEEGVFFWFQSLDAPELAFVVTDPSLWSPDYQATIRPEQMQDLGLERLDDAQIMVIVNRYGDALTTNLQGPIVINVRSGLAVQLVLAEKRWTTRHEIVRLEAGMQAASA